MLVMLRLTPFVAHLMLVMVLNMPEQCSSQDMLFYMLFMPKYAQKYASRMDISLISLVPKWVARVLCDTGTAFFIVFILSLFSSSRALLFSPSLSLSPSGGLAAGREHAVPVREGFHEVHWR